MSSGLFNQGSRVRTFGVGIVAAALVAACSGQAWAADRGGGGRGGSGGGGGHNGSYRGGGGGYHGGGHSDHHDSHSSFSISIGTGFYDYGSGWSTSFGYSSGGYCGPYYGGYYRRSYCAPVYCAPRPYCAPVVVAPVYAPPVVVVPEYTARTVVVSEPVVVQRPVVVERQVVVQRPVVVEKQVVVERPAPAPAAPVIATAPKPGTYRDRELGDAYLRLGDMENATRVYGRYLAAWDKDGTATRNIGLAQIATGHPQEGFHNVVTGYQLEPNLAERPLRIQDVGGAAGYGKLLDEATRSADSLNTSDAWVTVAMLQQMNGQKDAAVNALQKARDAGLDKDVLDSLTLALAK